jgi:energy-coupling factor transporter ATP-binding protein EcfA2
MYWITKISIDNYKAFPTAIKPIEITPLNHLLIYGENGSGKSSVYKAVRGFFRSSGKPAIPFELNEFSKNSGNINGTVELEISDTDIDGNINGTPSSYLFSSNPANSTHSIPVFQLADKLKGFLDYKAMLKAHFINVREGVNPNIFNFLVREILSDSQIPNPAGGTGYVDLLPTYQRISDDITKNAVTSKKHQNAIQELLVFNSSLNTLLRDVFGLTNKYFKEYFKDPKISVDLKISKIELIDIKGKKRLKEEIFFKISYAGTELPLYHAFLNEARLSALAISIFFASIKVYPLAAVDLRVIFLDDVFIGLDNSNRIPLLRLLKDEFSEENFQLFISSYDKEWFELVKQWFAAENIKYKPIEMYFDRDDDPATPDTSVIINAQSNFKKAEECFKTKDYAAAGTYLRKECEYIIKTLLPETFKITKEGIEITELEGLLQKLVEYFDA